mgnify:FL=1
MKRLFKATLSLGLALGVLGLSGCRTPAADSGSASAGGSQGEARRVEPLADTLDESALAEGDQQFTAGFRGSDIREDGGQLVIDLTVYTYDLYDAVDISMLAAGDTLVVKGEDIPVTAVAEENGGVTVNGGLENGGVDLISAGGGTFRVLLENDAPDLYEAGTITLPVAQDCVLTDDSDPEAPGRTLYAGDLLGLGDEVFSPQATTVETAGGMVTAIHRDYIP